MKTVNRDLTFAQPNQQLLSECFAGQPALYISQLSPLWAKINQSVMLYHQKKLALYHFAKPWAALNTEQEHKIAGLRSRQMAIEQAVLLSTEATQVKISQQHIKQAYQAIFTDSDQPALSCCDEFKQLLVHDQLQPEQLFYCVLQQCCIDLLMEFVAQQIEAVSRPQAHAYFLSHQDRFTQPEMRRVSHILITVNEALQENTYAVSLQRVQHLAEQLNLDPQSFAELAAQYSECPTALDAGQLGVVQQGTLYPELDGCLFKMQPGEMSAPIQTEIGFHILFCQEIKPSMLIDFDTIEEELRLKLTTQARQRKQKNWLRQVVEHAASSANTSVDHMR